MANITRRAALMGALVSSASLAVPIGRSLAAVRHRTVPDIAAELQAALRASGESWEVVVTADGHRINLEGPIDPWAQLVDQCDTVAAGCDGWRLIGGRSITDGQGRLVHNCEAPTSCSLVGIVLEAMPVGGFIERHIDMGRLA